MLILKNNQAIGANLSQPEGGAGRGGGLDIQNTRSGSSSLQNVVFDGNKAIGGSGSKLGGVSLGGGLFTSEMTLTGSNVTFTNNLAQSGSSTGDGIDAQGTFADALGGGASFSSNSTISLSHISAIGNKTIGGNAGTNGTAGAGLGGGLYSEDSNLTLNDVTINNNTAQGGVANIGGVGMGGGILTPEN